MRFGSVCSGIEAASVAWEPLGWSAAWLSEIEPFPSAVLAHHWPDVPNLGDMLTLPGMVRGGEIDAPDVLVGGTPCQAFSVAGRRGSLEDERGALTLAYVELANAIDERRAAGHGCVVVWENVPGVLNTKDNAFGCFLAGLAGETEPLQPSGKRWTNAGCVFGPKRAVAWRVLDAQYFGVAQRRRRVFVVASAREAFDPTEILFEREGVRRDIAPRRSPGKGFAADVAPSLVSSGRGVERIGETRGQDQVVAVPILEAGARTGKSTTDKRAGIGIGASGDPMFTLQAGKQHGVAQTVALRGRDGGATAELGGEVATALRASSGGGDKPHVMCVHGTQDPDVRYDYTHTLGRNNGSENAIAVTGDITHTLNTANNGKGCSEDGTGRGVPTVACWWDGGQISQTLDAVLHKGQTMPEKNRFPAVLQPPAMRVRRLMPVECERLQGFPDNHTNVPYRHKPAADGPRYKAIGNSMAVPVMNFIGQRIHAAINQNQQSEAA